VESEHHLDVPLRRAREEHDAAVARGDEAAAAEIARAITVLEQARLGSLIPGQRRPARDSAAEDASA